MSTNNKLECVARLEQLGIERSDAYAESLPFKR
jgi:hypothetical protein